MSAEGIDRLPADLEQLIASERDAVDVVPADVQARILSRLESSLAMSLAATALVTTVSNAATVATGATATSTAAATALTGASKGSMAWFAGKVGIAATSFVLGSGTGAAVYAVAKPEKEIVYVQVPVPAPVESVVAQPPVVAEPEIQRPAPLPAVERPRPAPPSASATSALTIERNLIEASRSALARGNFVAALEALDQHARKYPQGQLREEREAIAVQALVAAEKYDLAKERAARFQKAFPRSLLMAAVESALDQIPRP